MLKEEIKNFLTKAMPFSILSEEELDGIIKGIALEYYPKGAMIHTQGGPPCNHLGIIKKGEVKVYLTSEEQEETVIDYRSEGEMFGLLSLVSGDRSRTSIVVEEDTICYLIPKENVLSLLKNNPAANEYFLKSFFIDFIDKTQEQTRKKYANLANSEQLLFTTSVGEIVTREPVTASQDLTIQKAAQEMVKNKISSLIVVNDSGQPVGMVTDRDLREKVVAKGTSFQDPLQTIMSPTLHTINTGEHCFEALLKMIHHNIHHLLVMNDKKLKGMVTNHDFMALQGSSPTGLIREVEKIGKLDEFKKVVPKLYKTISTLLRNGAKAYNISGLITEVFEKITNSIVDFIEKERVIAPPSYSLFVFGQGGRKELSLDYQIELGIVYDDTNDPHLDERAKNCFKLFNDIVNDSLYACLGCNRFSMDPDHIRSYSSWKDFMQKDVTGETTGPRARFFEMRTIRGEKEQVEELRNLLFNVATTNEDFMELMVLSTVQNRPPLGFFKKFVVEKGGEHKNQLNLYQKGIKPLVDILRILALENGVTLPSSRGRLSELKKKNFVQARDVEHADDYLRSLLLHNQLLQAETGQCPDNFVNPGTLDTFEKNTLKHAFQLITALYEFIQANRKTGWSIN